MKERNLKLKDDPKFKICQLCNFDISSKYQKAKPGVFYHLKSNHPEYDFKSYFDEFFKHENEEICEVCGKQKKFTSKFLYSCSSSCASKITHKNSPRTREGYLKRHGVEGAERIRQNMSKANEGRFTLSWFQEKYGNELGLQKYEARSELCSSNVTLEGFKSRYGEVEGTKRFNKFLSRVDNSLTGFIRRYGEVEGQERYNIFLSRSKASLQNFIIKYGKERGKEKWNSFCNRMKYIQTFDYFKDVYGKEAEEYYHYHTINKYKNNCGQAISKSQQELERFILDSGIAIQCSLTDQKILEFSLDEYKKYGFRLLKPDIFYKNKVIEFYGTYWHRDIKDKDANREDFYRSRGIIFLIIEEEDWLEDSDNCIQRCVSFLKGD